MRRGGFELLIFTGFVVVAGLWWYPLPLHLRTGQLEHPVIDSAFNQWIVGWGAHALTHYPWRFFDANMFYPHSRVLAWGDHLFGITVFALPLIPLLGLVGAYNTLLILTTAASGYTAHRLALALGCDRPAAVLAGGLWSASAFRLIEYSHIQVLATQWVPLVFLAALWVLRRRRWATAALGVAAWLVLVTNVYLALYTAASFVVFAAVLAVARRLDRRQLVQLLVGWGSAAFAALPWYVPSILVQRDFHVVRSPAEQSSAVGEAFRPWPPPGHAAQIVASHVGHPIVYVRNYATPGMVTLGLMIVAVAMWARRRPSGSGPWLPIGVLAVFAVVASFGPHITWRGEGGLVNPVFFVLYHAVPGFKALRLPSRWLLFSPLWAGLIAGRGLTVAARRLVKPARWGLATVLLGLAIVEQTPAPIAVFDSYHLRDFPAYRWLSERPDEFPILELPISADLASPITQELEAKREFLSTFHWKRRVGGGVSPVVAPDYAGNALILNDLGQDRRAVPLLRRWRVRYVIVSPTDESRYGSDPDAVIARLDTDPALRRVRDFSDAVVYELQPGPGGATGR